MFRDNKLNQDDYTFFGSETRIDAQSHLKQKKPKNKVPILMMGVCILVSGMFGFAGGYISEQITQYRGVANVSREATLLTSDSYQPLALTVANNTSGFDNILPMVEVAAAVKQTVVEIITETVTTGGRMRQFIREGAGSGIIVSANGNIVTNNHVVSGARSITV